MWITILLIAANIIVILFLIYVVGPSMDSAPKFQIPIYDVSTNISPWDYYNSLRHKSWNELSEYEKDKIVLAAHIILDKGGVLSTLSELKEFLQIYLPDISISYPGEDDVLDGFLEWQNNKTL